MVSFTYNNLPDVLSLAGGQCSPNSSSSSQIAPPNSLAASQLGLWLWQLQTSVDVVNYVELWRGLTVATGT